MREFLPAELALTGAPQAQPVAFDFGTSPHGLDELSTESSFQGGQPPAVQDLRAPIPSLQAAFEACAEPDLPRPGHDVSPGVLLPAVFAAHQETIRRIQRASGEAHYPVVLSGSQMRLLERALFLAIDEAIKSMGDEPTAWHEIRPSLDACHQLYRVFKAAKAARKTKNEDWRGDMV